jgi:hypothetical protein
MKFQGGSVFACRKTKLSCVVLGKSNLYKADHPWYRVLDVPARPTATTARLFGRAVVLMTKQMESHKCHT